MNALTTPLEDLLRHIRLNHPVLSDMLSGVHYVPRDIPIPLLPEIVDQMMAEMSEIGGRAAVARIITAALDIAQMPREIEPPSERTLGDFDESGHRSDCEGGACACASDLMDVAVLMDKRLHYLPEHLKELVHDLTLMPGWSARLATSYEPGGAGGLHLWITSDTEDSMKPGERIRVGHPFLVPHASWSRDVWAAWLLDRFHDVLRHEGCEFFRIGGYREFAPHHANGEDPYRVWHVSDHEQARKRAGQD